MSGGIALAVAACDDPLPALADPLLSLRGLLNRRGR